MWDLTQFARLAADIWEKVFPSPQDVETKKKRDAKEAWDHYVEEEKKARESLYPNLDNRNRK